MEVLRIALFGLQNLLREIGPLTSRSESMLGFYATSPSVRSVASVDRICETGGKLHSSYTCYSGCQRLQVGSLTSNHTAYLTGHGNMAFSYVTSR